MPNSKFMKEVLFNDGEALTSADLNSLQRRLNSMVSDGVFGSQMRPFSGHNTSSTVPTSTVFSIGNAGAVHRHGTDNTVAFVDGMIFMTLAAGTAGEEPYVVPVYLDSTTLPNQTYTGASANPRWDTLYIEVNEVQNTNTARDFKDAITGALTTSNIDKERLVEITLDWVQGTESSNPTLPADPSPAANRAPLCSVLVKVGDEVPTGLALENQGDLAEFGGMIDWRKPLGFTEMQTIVTQSHVSLNVAHSYSNVVGTGVVPSISLPGTGTAVSTVIVGCPVSDPSCLIESLEWVTGQSSSVNFDTDVGLNTSNSVTALQAGYPKDRDGALVTNDVLPHSQHSHFFTGDQPLWANGYMAGIAAAVSGGDANKTGTFGIMKVQDSTPTSKIHTVWSAIWTIRGV